LGFSIASSGLNWSSWFRRSCREGREDRIVDGIRARVGSCPGAGAAGLRAVALLAALATTLALSLAFTFLPLTLALSLTLLALALALLALTLLSLTLLALALLPLLPLTLLALALLATCLLILALLRGPADLAAALLHLRHRALALAAGAELA
jgi:hypothetical protein